jgi:hypothetical protein
MANFSQEELDVFAPHPAIRLKISAAHQQSAASLNSTFGSMGSRILHLPLLRDGPY